MWEYFKNFLTASAEERNIKEEMSWAGYSEEQINHMTEENIIFFEKYALTPKEIADLTKQGFGETILKSVNQQMLTLGFMNDHDEDEGSGISPFRRDEIKNIALRKLKPIENNEAASFKKVLIQPNPITKESTTVDENKETHPWYQFLDPSL